MTGKIRWLVMSSAFGALLWFALAEGSAGAGNIIVAWASLLFVGGLLALTDEGMRAIRSQPRPVPRWLSDSIDLLFIGALLWNGWWWSGIAMLFAAGAVQGVRSKARPA